MAHDASTEPSSDAMAAAYERMRAADWPPLAEILASARRYQLLRGAAQRMGRGERVYRAEVEVTQGAAAPSPIRSTRDAARCAPLLPHHPPLFDNKRAAAGEREDD